MKGISLRLALTAAAILSSGASAADRAAAVERKCVNDAPNPYTETVHWGSLPEGRDWGSTAGIDVAPDGTIWVADRCGDRSCAASDLAPILQFKPDGTLLRAIGANLFVFPHGLTVDRRGNVWVTDSQAKDGRGMQAIKFGPDGKVLMRLGVAGSIDGDGALDQPTSVAVSPKGDVYVAEGHNPNFVRSDVVRYSANGKRLGVISAKGNEPGLIYGPHSIAFDSKGRLFVADRSNNRISIFVNGRFVEAWKQFGRPSGIAITPDDTIYVADSESNDGAGYGSNPGCKVGIRVGSAKTGDVRAFIPADPAAPGQGAPGAEGVAVDKSGSIYGAVNGAKGVRKYELKH